ncbi:YoaK family protein [Arthrobacter nitrophenolicus]|uniref:Uncharacterized membrane protein YoaK (UPF0700 family) n=1 Tax=Arthrobacter nitrophenolicus TaxID=683150 RepID=A0ACC6TJM8_9MICC|nr:YoaK family protein [Arthrobacter nitrophenolicus]
MTTSLHTPSAAPSAGLGNQADEAQVLAEKRWNVQLLGLLMVLTFGTGIVDAVGYLALDHVFIGNMTGNVVILGMAMAGADGLPVLGPLTAMVCFSIGAAVTGLVLGKRSAEWRLPITVLLLVAGFLLCSLGALASLVDNNLTTDVRVIISSLAAAAMGIQACVARKLAVREMTTVVVTSTLTALSGELFLVRGHKGLLNRRSAAIVVLLLGAALGALLAGAGAGPALIVSGALIVVVALLGQWGARIHRSCLST